MRTFWNHSRLSFRFSSVEFLARLALTVIIVAVATFPRVALADSNSVFLINATNGPLDQYTGTGINVGQIETGVPDTNNLLLAGHVVFTTNLFGGDSGTFRAH